MFVILHKIFYQAAMRRISDHRFFSYAFLFNIFCTLPVQSTCWYFKQRIINSQKIRNSNEFGHKSFSFDMVEGVHNYPCSHLPHLTLLAWYEKKHWGVCKVMHAREASQRRSRVTVADSFPIVSITRPANSFELVHIDLMGPRDPPSFRGHKYVLGVIDQATRWVEANPLYTLTAYRNLPNETTGFTPHELFFGRAIVVL